VESVCLIDNQCDAIDEAASSERLYQHRVAENLRTLGVQFHHSEARIALQRHKLPNTLYSLSNKKCAMCPTCDVNDLSAYVIDFSNVCTVCVRRWAPVSALVSDPCRFLLYSRFHTFSGISYYDSDNNFN